MKTARARRPRRTPAAHAATALLLALLAAAPPAQEPAPPAAPAPSPTPPLVVGVPRDDLRDGVAADLAVPASPSAGFYERMRLFEERTGRRSRMTLIGQLATLELPELPPAVRERATIAVEQPLTWDVGPLGNAVSAWQPALDLLFAAWDVPEAESFPAVLVTDPLPDFDQLDLACRLLCVRGQGNATIGNLDAAFSDFGTVWMIGTTLERSRPQLPTWFVGVRLRTMALQQMRAVIERLPPAPDRLEPLLRLFATQRAPAEAVEEVAARELRALFRSLELVDPAGREAAAAARNRLQLALDATAARPPHERLGARGEWERAVADAFAAYPALAEFGLPNVGEAHLRHATAEALERLVITWVLARGANHRLGGRPSSRDLEAFAGPWAGRLLDPFSGRPLLVANDGDARLTIVSVGPDGRAERDALGRREYDVRTGPDGEGDLFLQTPWNLRHPRHDSEPMGNAPEGLEPWTDVAARPRSPSRRLLQGAAGSGEYTYDPTNGTVSIADPWRIDGATQVPAAGAPPYDPTNGTTDHSGIWQHQPTPPVSATSPQ